MVHTRIAFMVWLLPIAAWAQGNAPVVAPSRVSAGGDLQISQSCTSGSPVVVLGGEKLPLRATGESDTWKVRLPATLKADAYSVGWSCDPKPGHPPIQLAIVQVLPVAPRVVAIANYKRDARVERVPASDRQPKHYRDQLKDVLTVDVENLAAWRQLPGNATTPLHLYLAGAELKTTDIELSSTNQGDGADISALRVVLDVDDKDPDSRKAWVQALNAALARKDRRIGLTVGPSGAPFQSDVTIALDVFPWYTWLVGLFLVVFTLLLIRLGSRSNLLRDANGAGTPPFSLAKHQMAVWFVVIVGAYLYVWLITGTFSSISTTALTLIGISGATGLIAMTMDTSKREEAAKARVSLVAERDALTSTLSDPGGLRAQLAAMAPGSADSLQVLAEIGVKQNRLNEVAATLAQPPVTAGQSHGWYRDLLSDDNGVSFHRLQMATWTIVLVAVFVRAVIADVLMPDFDMTLLGLLGISSTTYLGFKFPEQT